MLDHVQKRVEHSRREGHRRAIKSPQEPFCGVELEPAEFVDVSADSLHGCFRTIQKNSAAA